MYHTLDTPIRARYVRFQPKFWKNEICMRVELYGKITKGTKLCNWHFFPINYTFGPKLPFESVGLKMILIYFWLTIKRKYV